MKRIVLAFLFTCAQLAQATTAVKVGSNVQQSGTYFRENYTKNGTFEQNNKNSLTDANAIATVSASSPMSGTYSLAIDAGTSGHLVKMLGRTMTQTGGNCEATFTYTGDASLYKAYVLQGSTKVSAELTLQNAGTNFIPASLIFPCGAGTAPDVTIEATSASAAAFKIDDVYAGQPINIGTVAQASFFGGMEQAGAGSCIYGENTSTGLSDFKDLGTGSGCNAWTVSGSVTATGTNDHRPILSNLAPGTYQVFVSGVLLNDTANQLCTFRLSDGTTTYQPQGPAAPSAANGVSANTLVYSIPYITPQSSITLKLQAADNGAGNCQLYNSSNLNASWKIYYFPSSAQTVVNMNTSGWYVDATMDGANPDLGVSNVSSYTEITNASLTLKPQSGSAAVGVMCSSTNAATAPSTGNTTCAAGSESVGINFSIPTPGAYEVCWYGDHYGVVDTSEGINTAFQIIETPTNAQTLTLEGGTRQITSIGGMNIATGLNQSRTSPITNCSVFNWTSSGIKGVRVMYEQSVSGTPNNSLVLADADSATGQRNMRFTVKPVTTAMPMPLLVGGVVARDNTAGVTTINTVVSKSADYTATDVEETILVDSSGATRTITLPAAANYKGKKYEIIQTSTSNQVIIDGNASETICGSTTIRLSGVNDSVTIQSDGTNWKGLHGSCFVSHSVNGTSGGVVSNELGDWVSGNCTNAAPFVCTLMTGVWSVAPQCTGAGTDASARMYQVVTTTSSASVYQYNDTGSSVNNAPWQIVCQGPR